MHTRRNFGLDLVRATAITMVFCSHGISYFASFGVGVDLFFVLSGFLIGRIYLRAQADAYEPSGTFTLWSFWSARWFRTLPPYLAALALFWLFGLRFHNNPIHLYYLLFLQNYLGVTGFGPSWSLCVEEHFYLALPLLGYAGLRLFGRKNLVWLLPLLALVPQALRTAFVLHGSLPPDWFWMTHFHSEGLILGVWLAHLFVDRRATWERLYRPAFAVGLLPIVLILHDLFFPAPPNTVLTATSLQTFLFLLYAVGYTAWVRVLYDLRWEPIAAPARLLKSAIHGIALASYSIYLVHVLLFTDIRLAIGTWSRGPAKTLTILTGTILFSIVFYFAVERPTIVLRDRILNR